jgi:AcrR family transcriptional regulator
MVSIEPPRTSAAATKKQVVTEFRRSAILQAACRAFARCGYEATAVDTIAAEAGIAKGTVYLYYKSKAEIYHAAVVHGLEELHADTERALSVTAGCREKLERFFRLRADYVERNRDFYRIYLTELSGALKRPSALHRQIGKLYNRQAKMLEGVLAEGITKKEIRPVPAASTALAIYDLSRGLLRSRLNGLLDTDRTVDYTAVLDLLWNGLRPGK